MYYIKLQVSHFEVNNMCPPIPIWFSLFLDDFGVLWEASFEKVHFRVHVQHGTPYGSCSNTLTAGQQGNSISYRVSHSHSVTVLYSGTVLTLSGTARLGKCRFLGR